MCLNLGQSIFNIYIFIKNYREKISKSYLAGFKDPKQRVQEGWDQCCSSQWNSFRYPVYRSNNQNISTRGFLQGIDQ